MISDNPNEDRFHKVDTVQFLQEGKTYKGFVTNIHGFKKSVAYFTNNKLISCRNIIFEKDLGFDTYQFSILIQK